MILNKKMLSSFVLISLLTNPIKSYAKTDTDALTELMAELEKKVIGYSQEKEKIVEQRNPFRGKTVEQVKALFEKRGFKNAAVFGKDGKKDKFAYFNNLDMCFLIDASDNTVTVISSDRKRITIFEM